MNKMFLFGCLLAFSIACAHKKSDMPTELAPAPEIHDVKPEPTEVPQSENPVPVKTKLSLKAAKAECLKENPSLKKKALRKCASAKQK